MIDEKKLSKEVKEYFKTFIEDDYKVFGVLEANAGIHKIIEAQPKVGEWIPCSSGIMPDSGKYVLVSFENFSLADIGRYEEDEDGGGAFYPGDDEKSYASYGVFVNAWMELPKNYKEGAD